MKIERGIGSVFDNKITRIVHEDVPVVGDELADEECLTIEMFIELLSEFPPTLVVGVNHGPLQGDRVTMLVVNGGMLDIHVEENCEYKGYSG